MAGCIPDIVRVVTDPVLVVLGGAVVKTGRGTFVTR
jgi:hypothetical protein